MPGPESISPKAPEDSASSEEDISAIVDRYIRMDSDNPDQASLNGNSTPGNSESTPSTPPDANHDTGNTEPSTTPEQGLDSEKLATIKKAMGETALIATGIEQKDLQNVKKEVLELKTNETLKNSKALNLVSKVPVIGGVIKAGIAASHRRNVNSAIEESGDLSSAYDKLGLNASESRVLNSDREYTRERAWQTLENAGYRDDNQIDVATSRLDQNDRVEKMDDQTNQAVKSALNEYYSALKAGGNQEELSKKFDQQVKDAFAGKENLGTSIDLQKQKTGIEELANNNDIVEQDVKTYLDQHVSLYKASMKEGLYIDKKVDSIMGAVVAAGFVGGLVAIISSREARSEVRTAASSAGLAATGSALNAGIAGAAAGGAFGAVRGWQKARTAISESERKAATTFNEEVPEQTEATGDVSKTPKALSGDIELDPPTAPERPNVSEAEDAQAWIDYYDALDEYKAKLEAYEEVSKEPVEPTSPSVSKEEDPQAWDDYEKAKEEYDSKLARHKEFLRLRAERDGTSAEADDGSSTGEAEEGAETEPKPKTKHNVLRAIANFKRKLTGEEKLLKEIEDLRDRKDASALTEELESLMNDDSPESKDKLLKLYASIIARGRFSSEKHIDLIKYKGDDRNQLEAMLHSAEGKMGFDVDQAFSDEDSDLNKAIREQLEGLNNNYEAAKKKENAFKFRSAAVDAVSGAIIGFGAGALVAVVKNGHIQPLRAILGLANDDGPNGEIEGGIEDLDNLEGDAEFVEDPDGGYMVKIGDHELIGEGDAKGIEFNDDGSMTDESKELLENAGVHVQERVTEHHFETATKNVNVREFFDSANKEANNLTEVALSDRHYMPSINGSEQITMDDAHLDNEGNLIIRIAPAANSDVELDKMKLFLTPGNGNAETGITVDVNSDGTIEIPPNSPAASFFEGTSFKGGYGEIIQEGANGQVDVYSTPYVNLSGLDTVTVANEDAVYQEYDYTFNVGDKNFDVTVPEEVSSAARMEALDGIGSVKGVNGLIGYEADGEVTGLTTSSGEAVEVEHFEHHGGYSDTVDSYFGEKDGVYNSGASIVRQMVGSEGEGLSSQEVDQIFLDKVASGEIQEGDVVEEYLKTMGNSPEALTTTRAMLGDFKFDIDGDGAPELIDTQEEINLVSDIISRDPEAYDAFVNDTYSLFYEKIDGGQIRFIDYSDPDNQYQYTTWGIRGEGNNILQQLGITGNRTTDGVGIVFVDKYGNPIYDEATVRKLWNLPDDYDIGYIGDRLNCIQKTAHGIFDESTGDEPTGDEPTGDEPTGDEPTGDEPTGDEPTGDEPTGDEPTGDEPTGDEPTGDEPTGDEPTGDEPTGDEPTGDEPTGDEPTGDEPTGDEPTGDEPTGDEPTGDEPTGVIPKTEDPHAGDETDLPVTPEQEDDYVQPTPDNHVDPDVQPGSQVNDAPTDDSAFNPVDHDTSSGKDTQSTYSEDTSKWHGDTSDKSDPTPPPSKADPGSAEENNAPRSDEELANILEGEE